VEIEMEDRALNIEQPLTPTLSPSDGEREKTYGSGFMGSMRELFLSEKSLPIGWGGRGHRTPLSPRREQMGMEEMDAPSPHRIEGRERRAL
jgi:hypothetical protein